MDQLYAVNEDLETENIKIYIECLFSQGGEIAEECGQNCADWLEFLKDFKSADTYWKRVEDFYVGDRF